MCCSASRVPARVDSLRLRVEHAGADRVPGPAGLGRRRDAAHVDHHRRRHLHRRRAGADAGLPRERVGVSSVVGPALGGCSRSSCGGGSSSSTCRCASWPGVLICAPSTRNRAPHAPHRLRRSGAADRRDDPADPRCARRRAGLGVGLAGSIAVFTVGAVLLVAFVFVERRAAEPILPLWVLSRRLLVTTTLISLGVGAILIGLTSYVPTYLEGGIGSPPSWRPRAGRTDPRLADLCDLLGSAFYLDRVPPTVLSDGGRVSAPSPGRARRHAAVPSSPSPASSSDSASASSPHPASSPPSPASAGPNAAS